MRYEEATLNAGFNGQCLIPIERILSLDSILLKRRRIINRRLTLPDHFIDATEPNATDPNPTESPGSNTGAIVEDIAQTSGRKIFMVGRPDKTFRSIGNRRKSTNQFRSGPSSQIELFDAPITKSNDVDNNLALIDFEDSNFGRLTYD